MHKTKSCIIENNVTIDIYIYNYKEPARSLVSGFILQVFAIEFDEFAIEFVPFAIEFVAFAIEFVPFAIEFVSFATEFVPFAIEFVGFAIEFVRNKNGSWSKHENMM